MLAGLAIGNFAVRAAIPYGDTATYAAATGSVVLFIGMMIGGSVLGNGIRIRR
jgi:hypothetical protein